MWCEIGKVVTGASVAFLIASTVFFASVGEVIADEKALAETAVSGFRLNEGVVLALGRADLHSVEK